MIYKFFYIKICNFRCTDTSDDLQQHISLVVGETINTQLHSIILNSGKQSRYLWTKNNLKIWKYPLLILHLALQNNT